MKIANPLFFSFLVALSSGFGLLQAATFTLAPTADARIIAIGGTYEKLNFGSDILSVYTASGNIQRTFISFDLSSVILADNERVNQATLTLRASLAFGGNPHLPMEVYRVLEPWEESTLTWLQRDSGKNWGTPGGDFTGSADQPYSTSTAVPAGGQTVDWEVTELVDEWIEKVVPNYGLLLLSYSGNGLTFVQREGADPSGRPRLTITTTNGVPRLIASLNSSGPEVLLSWRGVGTAVLQERPDLTPTSMWVDSSLPIITQDGVSKATVAPVSNRFFRLRSTP